MKAYLPTAMLLCAMLSAPLSLNAQPRIGNRSDLLIGNRADLIIGNSQPAPSLSPAPVPPQPDEMFEPQAQALAGIGHTASAPPSTIIVPSPRPDIWTPAPVLRPRLSVGVGTGWHSHRHWDSRHWYPYSALYWDMF